MSIALRTVLPVLDPQEYKVHLASWNGETHPLDVFVRDRNEWKVWNTWRYGKDRFNLPYVFSLIRFYHEPDTWLFGGIYKVISRSPENYSHSYEVELDPTATEFIGRLKIRFERQRNDSIRLQNVYSKMVVSEILREPYSGEQFPGYENINHDFGTLEAVYLSTKPDWKAALENVKGVYLISDKSNGKRYVGSVYGASGLWQRWECYISTGGHGGNDELTKLIQEEGIEYARKNFRVALLEYRPARTHDDVIIERENYWKEALLSRGKFGYNLN